MRFKQLAVVIVLLLVIGIGWVVAVKSNAGSKPVATPAPTPTPTPIVWKSEEVIVKRVLNTKESEMLSLKIQIPESWVLSKTPRIEKGVDKKCPELAIANSDATVKMILNPICTRWSSSYADWPEGAVVINEKSNVGPDAHVAYTLRYFDTNKNEYLYIEGDKGETNKVKDTIVVRYATPSSYLPVQVRLLDIPGEKEPVLRATDQIVAKLLE